MMCAAGIGVSNGFFMSVESLGRRAIPTLVRLGARSGVTSLRLLKGLNLRIASHGPPVHVYPVHAHTPHLAHPEPEPEPYISHQSADEGYSYPGSQDGSLYYQPNYEHNYDPQESQHYEHHAYPDFPPDYNEGLGGGQVIHEQFFK